MKNQLKRAIKVLADLMGANPAGRYLYAQIISAAMNRTQKVRHSEFDLLFAIPNALNKYRADTFFTKEPETLRWIDGFEEGSVLWDIGANVGLYSIYAAKKRNCRVFAFEPSVFNLELLARNVWLNDLSERISIVPLPVAASLSVNTLHMSNVDWGGALSTFGESYGHDGRPLQEVFKYSTLGLSMNQAVELLDIPSPDYIKIDVDGTEHLILNSGSAVLRQVSSVLVELNENFRKQAEESVQALSGAGLVLAEKGHAHETTDTALAKTANQIWRRPSNS